VHELSGWLESLGAAMAPFEPSPERHFRRSRRGTPSPTAEHRNLGGSRMLTAGLREDDRVILR